MRFLREKAHSADDTAAEAAHSNREPVKQLSVGSTRSKETDRSLRWPRARPSRRISSP